MEEQEYQDLKEVRKVTHTEKEPSLVKKHLEKKQTMRFVKKKT